MSNRPPVNPYGYTPPSGQPPTATDSAWAKSSPYASPGRPPGPSEPPRRFPGLVWIGLLVVGLMGGVTVCCCGLGIGAVHFGFTLIAEELRPQIAGDPVIVEHLGGVESMAPNHVASIAYDDPDTFVYDVVGPKGRAQVVIRHVETEDGGQTIEGALLRKPDGTEIPLASYPAP